jgi:D-alanyl-D-alanine carboxypeptidase
VKVKASMLPSIKIGHALHTQPAQAQTPAPTSMSDEAKSTVIAKAAETPAAQPAATRSSAGSDWMIQVGALESQHDANERLANARAKAAKFLSKAKSFTEPIIKADMKLWRARFSGITRDDAEAACKTLKSAKIVCITLKN